MKGKIILILLCFVTISPLSFTNAEVPVGGVISYTLNVSGASQGTSYDFNASNFHFTIKSISQNATMTQFEYTSDNDTYFDNAFSYGLGLTNNTFYINSTGMIPNKNFPATIPFFTPANYSLYNNYTAGYYFPLSSSSTSDRSPMYYNCTSLNEPYQLKVDGTTQTVNTWKLGITNRTNYFGYYHQIYNSSLLYAKDTSTLLSWNFHYRQIENGVLKFQVNVSIMANEASNIPFVIVNPTTSSSNGSSSASSTSTISLAGFEIIPALLGPLILARKYRKQI